MLEEDKQIIESPEMADTDIKPALGPNRFSKDFILRIRKYLFEPYESEASPSTSVEDTAEKDNSESEKVRPGDSSVENEWEDRLKKFFNGLESLSFHYEDLDEDKLARLIMEYRVLQEHFNDGRLDRSLNNMLYDVFESVEFNASQGAEYIYKIFEKNNLPLSIIEGAVSQQLNFCGEEPRAGFIKKICRKFSIRRDHLRDLAKTEIERQTIKAGGTILFQQIRDIQNFTGLSDTEVYTKKQFELICKNYKSLIHKGDFSTLNYLLEFFEKGIIKADEADELIQLSLDGMYDLSDNRTFNRNSDFLGEFIKNILGEEIFERRLVENIFNKKELSSEGKFSAIDLFMQEKRLEAKYCDMPEVKEAAAEIVCARLRKGHHDSARQYQLAYLKDREVSGINGYKEAMEASLKELKMGPFSNLEFLDWFPVNGELLKDAIDTVNAYKMLANSWDKHHYPDLEQNSFQALFGGDVLANQEFIQFALNHYWKELDRVAGDANNAKRFKAKYLGNAVDEAEKIEIRFYRSETSRRLNWERVMLEDILPEAFVASEECREIGFKNMLRLFENHFLEAHLDDFNFYTSFFKFKRTIFLERSVDFTKIVNKDSYPLLDELAVWFDFPPQIIEAAKADKEFFGENRNLESFRIIKAILTGELTDDLKRLGISQGGQAGLKELKVILTEFKSKILDADFDRKTLANPVLKTAFKAYVRFEKSEWGQHDDDAFARILADHADGLESGEISSLSAGYAPSQVLHIKKVSKKRSDDFAYSEHFSNRYRTIINSVQAAFGILEGNKKPLSLLAKKINEKKEQVIENLKITQKNLSNIEAQKEIMKKIKSLENVKVRSLPSFRENFMILSKFDDFRELLRELVFFMAIQKHRGIRKLINQTSQNQSPSLEEISTMINFVDHITNQETMAEYFPDKESSRAFLKIVNVRSFSEELARMQNRESIGVAKLRFVPSRGLPMEFSGHIADACWASNYDSIARYFPNFTSVIMVQNPGTKDERLAGAAMLIETESEEGEKLLVIRGLNPIENLINSLQAEDFFKNFKVYARGIAESSGRKLAIVIDDHTGGASTNRPVLFQYLSENARGEKVRLKSHEDTDFNGYGIVDDCYLL